MICSKRRGNFNVKSLKPVMVIISILQLLASSMAVAQNENSHESVFYIADDASLTGNVTMVALSKDDLDCSLLCLRSPYPHNCFSFNFGRHKKNGLHTCELNNSEKILLPHRMQSRGGFDYYGMQRDVSLTVLLVFILEMKDKISFFAVPLFLILWCRCCC